jgi:thiamine phosphate synthase YjbQ (UPF0047 family)
MVREYDRVKMNDNELRALVLRKFYDPTSQYPHNRTGDANADAHLKRQIMGREVVVLVTNGKLDLGPWEHISTESLMGIAQAGVGEDHR